MDLEAGEHGEQDVAHGCVTTSGFEEGAGAANRADRADMALLGAVELVEEQAMFADRQSGALAFGQN